MTLAYRSTRSEARLGSFTDILLEGLSPDGGLAVPEHLPQLKPGQLQEWAQLPYPELAAQVMALYADDLGVSVLRPLAARAYSSEKFGDHRITPLHVLGVEGGAPLGLLSLSNGPTLAFKDLAMQMLGELFEYVLSAQGRTLNILGATSGDTGGAAEYAMRDKPSVSVFMLSPEGRMSAFQRAQMYSLQEPRIHNLTVPGSFDVCQDLVKAVSADLAFKAQWRIGTVNSINWARITAQVVYYFAGYFQAVSAFNLRLGDAVSFSVPSGNFGNVLSGYMAQRMGLPVAHLVVATNENRVLDEFFKTGCYRPRSADETHLTSSPSMDISKASNFERYVFDVVGEDSVALDALWQTLAKQGSFELKTSAPHWSRVEQSRVQSGASNHAQRLLAIRDVAVRYNRVIDPHTADGLVVARGLLERDVPMVCLETALPAKFSETIEEALGHPAPRPSGLVGLESLPQRVTRMPADLQALKTFISERGL